MRPSPRPHPVVKAAAVVLVVGAAAVGVAVGSLGGPQPATGEGGGPDVSFLPAAASGPDTVTTEAGLATFERRCASCHTIGGGPGGGHDLATAALRRDPLWVAAMITAPDSMFRSDSLAGWVLQAHDLDRTDVERGAPELRALAEYFAGLMTATAR